MKYLQAPAPKSEYEIRYDNFAFVTFYTKKLRLHQSICPGTEAGFRALEERRRKARDYWHNTAVGRKTIIKCKEYSKTFKSNFHYQEHTMKVHLKETPYHCELCPQKFAM